MSHHGHSEAAEEGFELESEHAGFGRKAAAARWRGDSVTTEEVLLVRTWLSGAETQQSASAAAGD